MTEYKRLISYSLFVLILCSCASISPKQQDKDDVMLAIEDDTLVYAAKAELASVQTGLLMYRAENIESRYPSVMAIFSYGTLRYHLSPFVRLPDEYQAPFIFKSYVRAMPDTFVLQAWAKDSKRTVITVTPTSITPPP